MKKIVCILLALMFVFSLCACGGNGGESSGTNSEYNVDSNTVNLVNDAYKKTGEALKSSASLGYNVDYKKTMTVDENSVAVRLTTGLDYIKSEEGNIISYNEVLKSDDLNTELKIYDDKTRIYGLFADTPYIITRNDAAKERFEKWFGQVVHVDASTFKVIDTVVVDTAGGGHGFVLEYDPAETGFDVAGIYGDLYNEKDLGVKPTGIRISGIIDTDGRLTSEIVTYTYSYEFEQEVENPDVDPDNTGANSTVTVKKTVVCELVAEFTFDYGITEIGVPDGITVYPAEPTADVKLPKELSISDFEKLANSNGEDQEGNKTEDKKNNT